MDFIQIINNSGGGGGTVQHNSTAGLQGGQANQYYHFNAADATSLAAIILQQAIIGTLVGGTYTPTLTNVTNISANTAYQCQYLRVGNTVVVSGKVDVDPTAAGAAELGISLPVASNFGATEDCAGAGAAPAVAGFSTALLADITNDRAAMQWVAVDTANRSVYFTFAYQVI